MSLTKIASRYAKSLLDLSVERDALETILGDIKIFKAATENRDFYLLLKSPIVSKSKKTAILNEIFEGKVDKLTLSFIDILVRKGRESYLPEVAEQFIFQYQVMKSISTVKLTTATPISEEQLGKIKDKLSVSTSTLNNIEIETLIDKELIGGFVIQIGDTLYDASIAHKLRELSKKFQDNEYIKSY